MYELVELNELFSSMSKWIEVGKNLSSSSAIGFTIHQSVAFYLIYIYHLIVSAAQDSKFSVMLWYVS